MRNPIDYSGITPRMLGCPTGSAFTEIGSALYRNRVFLMGAPIPTLDLLILLDFYYPYCILKSVVGPTAINVKPRSG